MSNRYWIGDSGNTNDTAEWSATTGGAGGASVPTSADNVFFDANSFSGGGLTVTVNATFSCLNMDWTGATNSPTFAGASAIQLYGNLTLISAMTWSQSAELRTIGSGSHTITSNTTAITSSALKTFHTGTYTLQDAFDIGTGNIQLNIAYAGTIDTNGMDVTCGILACVDEL